VIKFLKSLFAKRKPGTSLVSSPAPKPTRKRLSLAAFERVMEQIGPLDKSTHLLLDLPKIKFEVPKLPDGVVPKDAAKGKYQLTFAMDGTSRECDYMALDDASGGSNFGFLNTSPFFGEVSLTFPGFAFLSTLQQISEYRAPCEVTSTEMTREWIKVTSKGGNKDQTNKIKEITERIEELKIKEKFQTVMLFDGQFGGGFLYWQFKGEESDEARQLPKIIDQIKQGSLIAVTAIEPYWCTPFSYNADRPEREDFYVPQSWFVMGRKTHLSRLMVIVSRPVPDLVKPAYNFVGISLAQLMFPYIQRWLRTAKSVNDLINTFSIVNLKTNMQSTLEDGGDNGLTLFQRLKLFTATRDNQGTFATDKDDEELEILNVTLAGLHELQAQAQEHMAAPSHIPLIKLFGVTPTGLGATGEGEIQVWYDWVAAQQSHALGDHVNRMLEIVQMDLYGTIDDDITYEWVPLFQPTPKEQSELNKTEAERDAAYITNSVVTPDEVRKKLIADPNSGYDGLTGDAPESEEDVDEEGNPIGGGDPDADKTLEHASSEADKDRKHEATENDKDRKNALALAAKKKSAAK
jgi:phage-related protein (TIGR01555 family)